MCFQAPSFLLEPVTCAAWPSFSARDEQGLGGKERWGGREETHPGPKYPLGVRAGGAQLKGSASLLLTRGESPHTRQENPHCPQHLNPTSTVHTWGRTEGTDPFPVRLAVVHPRLKATEGPWTQGGQTPGEKKGVPPGGRPHPSQIPSLCVSRVSLSAGLLLIP